MTLDDVTTKMSRGSEMVQRVPLSHLLPHVQEATLVRVDPTEGRISIYDLISSTCNTKNAKEAFSNLARANCTEMNAMGVEPRPFSGRAQQLTPTIPLASLGAFLKIALMGARIPLQRKLHLLGQDEPPLLKVYAETEICHRLAVVFAGLEPELQKPAAGFRVDLYLHVPRVAIECDEGGHKGYCLQGEIERERRVTAALDCVFVRFDPYAPGFCVFALIARIMQTVDMRCPRAPCLLPPAPRKDASPSF